MDKSKVLVTQGLPHPGIYMYNRRLENVLFKAADKRQNEYTPINPRHLLRE